MSKNIHDENRSQILAYYLFIFQRFWVKEPRHSETISDQKCYLHRGPQGECLVSAVAMVFRTQVVASAAGVAVVVAAAAPAATAAAVLVPSGSTRYLVVPTVGIVLVVRRGCSP